MPQAGKRSRQAVRPLVVVVVRLAATWSGADRADPPPRERQEEVEAGAAKPGAVARASEYRIFDKLYPIMD